MSDYSVRYAKSPKRNTENIQSPKVLRTNGEHSSYRSKSSEGIKLKRRLDHDSEM